METAICADNIQLYAQQPAFGTGYWHYEEPGTIADTNQHNSMFTNVQNGANHLYWITQNDKCIFTDELTIHRETQPDPAYAGKDTSFCNFNNIQLYANVPNHNGKGFWQAIAGGADFANINQANTTITNVDADTSLLEWRVESEFNSCPQTRDTMQLVRDIMPGMANTAINDTVCSLASYPLVANAVTGNGTGWWTVVSGSATVADSSQHNTNLLNMGYGLNQATWQIRSKLQICPQTVDTATVYRFEQPANAFAGLDSSFCDQYSVMLNANLPSVGTGTWQVTNSPVGASPVIVNSTHNQSLFNINPGEEGNYTLRWEIVNGPCTTADEVVLRLGATPPCTRCRPQCNRVRNKTCFIGQRHLMGLWKVVVKKRAGQHKL
ncbi:MAG: hypothetical protein HC896_11355 [Bacteroidales bacterium]|nr:hypothetical protein [Bacteroidales bacterium]